MDKFDKLKIKHAGFIVDTIKTQQTLIKNQNAHRILINQLNYFPMSRSSLKKQHNNSRKAA